MKFLKKYLLDILVVIAFAIISFVYFMPADMDGRILFRHDAAAGKGLGHEKELFQQQTGETTRWTNSVFGGMPTYQMSPSYDSNQVLSQIVKAYHLWLPDYVWYVFVYLLGFYIMLRAFNFRQSLAALGSIIWAFSSYFFIIIAAGHIWKVWALAYLPPMIAGVVLAYRGKYLKGLLLTAIFSAFEVQANHVQMTYYYLFIILFMVIAFLVDAIRKGELARFGKATAVCVVGALIGISLNLSNLYHTWQYGQETMRGKSELVKKNVANQTSSGLIWLKLITTSPDTFLETTQCNPLACASINVTGKPSHREGKINTSIACIQQFTSSLIPKKYTWSSICKLLTCFFTVSCSGPAPSNISLAFLCFCTS